MRESNCEIKILMSIRHKVEAFLRTFSLLIGLTWAKHNFCLWTFIKYYKQIFVARIFLKIHKIGFHQGLIFANNSQSKNAKFFFWIINVAPEQFGLWNNHYNIKQLISVKFLFYAFINWYVYFSGTLNYTAWCIS